jgi:myosin-1
MEVCNIGVEEQRNLLQITAGILHLGNIDFYEDNNAAIVADDNSLAYPAYLVRRIDSNALTFQLGVDPNFLRGKLTRFIKSGEVFISVA